MLICPEQREDGDGGGGVGAVGPEETRKEPAVGGRGGTRPLGHM